ncbi:hypothetical protein BJ684DRAFT_12150 [Piptocephalis cylindrospora]|uniref:25S rRNA (uridine-N(3))-methyltransferase BMT5-like domain-containing protein n=1 Tax=Piptocephalis cylindrospora TaxID=1907219 RepID=A0A4P9Y0J2_9FUNG|nr:hypothetical protein BJ684DRAFT_12150 [Piptocephalis cylindrospora]|eukprot:RKP11992.1 hypothetical protein BJ684DRAFT_12150 [Piptocephalis cylindrospora]
MSRAYTPDDAVLLVGEGNFSFARSLIENYLHTGHQVVATAFDEEAVAIQKYGEAEVGENVQYLRDCEALVLFGVDATALGQCKELRGKSFTRIIFNFPHVVGAGIKDQNRNIRANQQLITSFLTSAQPLLSETEAEKQGEIHITIKTKAPYDAWRIKALARRTEPPLKCAISFQFDCKRWPGYEHRRTLGFKEGLSHRDNVEILDKDPRTYVFTRPSEEEEVEEKIDGKRGKKINEGKAWEGSSDEDEA